MAERRMFAKSIVLSDAFLDMPMSARCLYFTLGMLADDDGFINSPKSIMRQIGASADDMNVLVTKKFVILFDSGVIVIKHWRINNYLRSDRYKETNYVEERSTLEVEKNGAYTTGIPMVYPGKDSIGKDSIGKDSSKPTKHKYGEYSHVLLTDDEYDKLVHDYPQIHIPSFIKKLDEGIEMKGYKYKSHYLALRKWIEKDIESYHKNNDTIPTYTTDNNPDIDESRLAELMKRRGA